MEQSTASSSTDHTKLGKKELEKLRRDRLNSGLDNLKKKCHEYGIGAGTKYEKTDIVENTIELIEMFENGEKITQKIRSKLFEIFKQEFIEFLKQKIVDEKLQQIFIKFLEEFEKKNEEKNMNLMKNVPRMNPQVFSLFQQQQFQKQLILLNYLMNNQQPMNPTSMMNPMTSPTTNPTIQQKNQRKRRQSTSEADSSNDSGFFESPKRSKFTIDNFLV